MDGECTRDPALMNKVIGHIEKYELLFGGGLETLTFTPLPFTCRTRELFRGDLLQMQSV